MGPKREEDPSSGWLVRALAHRQPATTSVVSVEVTIAGLLRTTLDQGQYALERVLHSLSPDGFPVARKHAAINDARYIEIRSIRSVLIAGTPACRDR